MFRRLSHEEIFENFEICYPSSPRAIGIFRTKSAFSNIDYMYFNTGSNISLGIWRGKFLENICFNYRNLENKQKFSYLYFILGNDFLCKDGKNKEIIFTNNVCYNGEFCFSDKNFGFYKKNQSYICIGIIIDKKLYDELFKNKNTKLIFKGDSFNVNFHNHISPKQELILRQILSSPFCNDDLLGSVYLESKILELIYETARIKQSKSTDIFLDSDDLESLKKAKKILVDSLQNPPSLDELAHKTAINTYKLKKGFKYLYGDTVFGFLQKHRLEVAKELLESGDISVFEASKMVGYKSTAHFSVIFKEKFGINPIEIKKSCKFYELWYFNL